MSTSSNPLQNSKPQRTWKHLNEYDREKIGCLIAKGKNMSEIAKELGVHRSTISRELRRFGKVDKPIRVTETKDKGKILNVEYSCIKAHADYQAKMQLRGSSKRKIKVDSDIYQLILELLKVANSPERIVMRINCPDLLELGLPRVSTPTIYKALYDGLFKQLGPVKKLLTRKSRAYKRRGHKEKRGHINVTGHKLDKRPLEANLRIEVGHWELDTVLGKHKKACLVTLVERSTRYAIVVKISRKNSQCVVEALTELKDWSHLFKSITPDNGKEFAKHNEISKILDCDFFFPNPGEPWQRGTNESFNGELRRYFPKKTDFSNVSDEEIQSVVDQLNNRPMKVLGGYTPAEMMHKAIHNLDKPVCFHTPTRVINY